MENRKARLAKLKKGPGVFVYLGGAMDTEATPTPLLGGKKVVALSDSGLPILDASGRPTYQPAGMPVLDGKGRPMLGGQPKIKHIELSTFLVRGVPFAKGEQVTVGDEQLALKLRGMRVFEEIESAPEAESAEDKPGKRKKRSA